jgi:hypothetical protein
MEQLDRCKNLRVYGVYQFEKYPDWDIVVVDIGVNDFDEKKYLFGLAFSKTGFFQTLVTLSLPMIGQEVGYVYIPNIGYSLFLEFHNRS